MLSRTRLPLTVLCLLTRTVVRPARLSSAPPGEETESPRPLAVVRTWQDLERQPVTVLRWGMTVRLGIEADRCPHGGGVFIYCLTERYRPSWSMADGRLDPLSVVLSRPKVTRPLSREDEEKLILRSRGGGFERSGHLLPLELMECRLLFVYPVAVAQPGVVGVQVWDRFAEEPRCLARAEVRGTPELYHSWVLFEEVHGAGRRPGEPEYTVRHGGGGVLPCWPATRPIVVSGVVEGRKIHRPPEERLPALVPTTPDPSLKLTAEQDVLTVRCKNGFGKGGPGERLLARWWVNGRPFIPKESAGDFSPKSAFLRTFSRVDWEPAEHQEIRLRLDPDPGRLWANSGDRIGLQLLSCESGWQQAAGDRTLNQGQERDAPPLLSNRVEFRAP